MINLNMGMRFLILIFYFSALVANAQRDFKNETWSFQSGYNASYRSYKSSPLSPEARRKFKRHKFFPLDSTFCVTARIVLLENQPPVKLMMSTGSYREFIKCAELFFVLKGKEYKLTGYTNAGLQQGKTFAREHFFVPFRDASNGSTTYAGGRFLMFKFPKGNTIPINFNLAYNPPAAYIDGDPWPTSLEDNSMDLYISVGTMMPKK